MKVLWLAGSVPNLVCEKYGITNNKPESWIDGLYSELSNEIEIVFLLPERLSGFKIDWKTNKTHFISYSGENIKNINSLQSFFESIIEKEKPDCIHIWGTESERTLAMIKAAECQDLLEKTVIHIQGLIYYCSMHYTLGLPENIISSYTIRDFIRRGNISKSKEKYRIQGLKEIEALKAAKHVLGRTDWDHACVTQVNNKIQYHYCGEVLRNAFYTGSWSFEKCEKHSLFVSQSSYPIKGFHLMLMALPIILERFPDAHIYTTGKCPVNLSKKEKLRQTRYQKYIADLIRNNNLKDKVTYLGILDENKMKEQYLKTNVFVCCSTIENSPNSLGEAMILGVPIVCSDVGGVKSMISHELSGLLYQCDAPYMLADCVIRMFENEDFAVSCGNKAQIKAKEIYDKKRILGDIYHIYNSIC